MKGATPGHKLFNKMASKDAARLAHLAAIRARLAAEGKRVGELRKSSPKKMDERLHEREKKTKEELEEFNRRSPIEFEEYRKKIMIQEEKDQVDKMNAKSKLEDVNMKSVVAQAAAVASGREAALDNAESAKNEGGEGDEGFFYPDGASALVEEDERKRMEDVDDPYSAVMTDAHAEIALARDELKEKRNQHQRLLERAAEQVRDEQVASEKAFRKYLIDNKKSATEQERRSPFLRSQR
jgi:hypothetical protein